MQLTFREDNSEPVSSCCSSKRRKTAFKTGTGARNSFTLLIQNMTPDGQAISRQDLKDTALVSLILLIQSAIPFIVRVIRGSELFSNRVVFYFFNSCVVLSWPLLGAGSLLLLRAAGLHSRDNRSSLMATNDAANDAESQLQWAGCGAGVIAIGCFIQSMGGMIWLAEARLHSRSLPLIALAIVSSAILFRNSCRDWY